MKNKKRDNEKKHTKEKSKTYDGWKNSYQIMLASKCKKARRH